MVKMIECVKQMAKDFCELCEKLTETSNAPAAEHLFNVRDDMDKLDEEHAQQFHTFAAKGSFLCKRTRPDAQTAIAHLTTWTSKPDKCDWMKLVHMMQG